MSGYAIQGGVRQAIAAPRAGRADIPAVVHTPGRPDLVTRLPLGELWSPKAIVTRDARYIRYNEYPTAVLGTDPPPIEVQPLGLPGQPPLIPLAAVQLV